jgi:V/A-type H+-transporting ATPase subunit B
LNYGARFEQELMDLSVNIPLFAALDRGWKILADCFQPAEAGLRRDLMEKYWPAKAHDHVAH